MIKLDWTLILQFVNFIVLMFVLNLLLYRPLQRILAKRRETIEGDEARARDLAAQIDEKMARYQQQLQEAKSQGAQEKAQLRQAAAKEEAQILGAAQGEASELLQQIKSQVNAEAETARKTLKNETDALAGQVAAKVLGRAL